MVSYTKSNYTNEFYDLTGYFNPTNNDLDKRYLLKSGGSINGDISVSGNLFKPNNPAFKVTYTIGGASQVLSAVQPLPYGTIIYDTTNSYNTTNFQYIVPVAGKYFFSAGWLSGSTTFSVDIRKNGVIIKRTRLNNIFADFTTFQSHTFINCAVNDIIDVQIILGSVRVFFTSTGEQANYFEGFKID